jgi:hypothetical protein
MRENAKQDAIGTLFYVLVFGALAGLFALAHSPYALLTGYVASVLFVAAVRMFILWMLGYAPPDTKRSIVEVAMTLLLIALIALVCLLKK